MTLNYIQVANKEKEVPVFVKSVSYSFELPTELRISTAGPWWQTWSEQISFSWGHLLYMSGHMEEFFLGQIKHTVVVHTYLYTCFFTSESLLKRGKRGNKN